VRVSRHSLVNDYIYPFVVAVEEEAVDANNFISSDADLLQKARHSSNYIDARSDRATSVDMEKRTVGKSGQEPTISEHTLANVTACDTTHKHLRLVEYLCHAHDICWIEVLIIWFLESVETKAPIVRKVEVGISASIGSIT
jgi:hypothetical protein